MISEEAKVDSLKLAKYSERNLETFPNLHKKQENYITFFLKKYFTQF